MVLPKWPPLLAIKAQAAGSESELTPDLGGFGGWGGPPKGEGLLFALVARMGVHGGGGRGEKKPSCLWGGGPRDGGEPSIATRTVHCTARAGGTRGRRPLNSDKPSTGGATVKITYQQDLTARQPRPVGD